MDWLKAALGFAATTYLTDTIVKPRQIGKLAREYCDRTRKPLLLIHDAGVAHHVFGAPVKAEVTRRTAYPVSVRDKTFGAVLAVGVLECLRKPDRALTEWRRVADRVFVVVPSWYSPHAWLNPEHRWFIDPSISRARGLWTNRRGVYLLQVSDKRYRSRQCNRTTQATPPPAMAPNPSIPSTSPSPPVTHLATVTSPPPQPPSPSPTPTALPAPSATEPVPLPDMEEVSWPSLAGAPLPNVLSGSSKSVSDLMVISGPRSDES